MRLTNVSTALALVLGLGIGLGIGLSTGTAQSQEQEGAGGAEEPAAAGPSAEEMAAFEKFMTPGEQHARMAKQVGAWKVAGKMWMAGPDAPPTESAGEATFSMVLGGRYQMQEYSGSMMGMPFEGRGISAFDNVKQQYQSVWMDTFGTAISMSSGTRGEDGVLRTTGKMPGPSGADYDTREVITDKGDDEFVMEMFMSGADLPEETRIMELTYTRRTE